MDTITLPFAHPGACVIIAETYNSRIFDPCVVLYQGTHRKLSLTHAITIVLMKDLDYKKKKTGE